MADNEEIGHYNDQNQVSITKCRTGVKIGLAFLFFYLDAPKLAAYPKIVPAQSAQPKTHKRIKLILTCFNKLLSGTDAFALPAARVLFFGYAENSGASPKK